MNRSLLAGLALAATFSVNAMAYETYEVTGVKAGDTLTMREQPVDGGKPAEWKAVGAIPASAKAVLGTGRSVQASGQRWLEVSHGQVLGWVNAKHLQGVHGDADPGGVTFQCGGTEPFWSVSLSRDGADYSDPEIETGKKLSVAQTVVAQARPGIPFFYRLKDQSGAVYQAVVSQREWCSDGMSDFDYAFEVMFSGESSLMQGCCSIKR